MRSLWGMVRVDRPKKVRLVNGGLDRSPGRGVAGWQVLLCGWGGAALAGEVCCHWSQGSGRLLPLGTSPAGGREKRGGPSWPPGSGLTQPILQWIRRDNTNVCMSVCGWRKKEK